MKKYLLIIAALFAVSCSTELPVDRLVCGGRTVKDIEVIVNEQPAEGFEGMMLRTVTFVNSGQGRCYGIFPHRDRR